MYFKPYYLGCLSHASYLIGGSNGEAVVIDPRRDIEEYLVDAKAANLRIAYVIETHLHADFVSGHFEMARKTGARIVLGSKSEVDFDFLPAHDGESLKMGDTLLTFLETPGHTPEGISVLLSLESEEAPKMLFTGDTLFIGDVGRPDLVGSKGFTAEQMAESMYYSLKNKILTLPDAVEVWPAHGAGSSCGRALSDDKVSTIGREKALNPALKPILEDDKEGFIQSATAGLGAPPSYFFHDAVQNRLESRSVEDILSSAKPLSPQELEEASEQGILVLDTRHVRDFAKGHIPGAVNIQLEGRFAPWVGLVLSPHSPLIVVADEGAEVEAMTRLIRVGYENIQGWLVGGMRAWRAAGGEEERITLIGGEEASTAPRLLDVRTAEEFAGGHFDTAQHLPLTDLLANLGSIPKESLCVVCGTGYRASIAASLLQRHGWSELSLLEGGWSGYIAQKEQECVAH